MCSLGATPNYNYLGQYFHQCQNNNLRYITYSRPQQSTEVVIDWTRSRTRENHTASCPCDTRVCLRDFPKADYFLCMGSSVRNTQRWGRRYRMPNKVNSWIVMHSFVVGNLCRMSSCKKGWRVNDSVEQQMALRTHNKKINQKNTPGCSQCLLNSTATLWALVFDREYGWCGVFMTGKCPGVLKQWLPCFSMHTNHCRP